MPLQLLPLKMAHSRPVGRAGATKKLLLSGPLPKSNQRCGPEVLAELRAHSSSEEPAAGQRAARGQSSSAVQRGRCWRARTQVRERVAVEVARLKLISVCYTGAGEGGVQPAVRGIVCGSAAGTCPQRSAPPAPRARVSASCPQQHGCAFRATERRGEGGGQRTAAAPEVGSQN